MDICIVLTWSKRIHVLVSHICFHTHTRFGGDFFFQVLSLSLAQNIFVRKAYQLLGIKTSLSLLGDLNSLAKHV